MLVPSFIMGVLEVYTNNRGRMWGDRGGNDCRRLETSDPRIRKDGARGDNLIFSVAIG